MNLRLSDEWIGWIEETLPTLATTLLGEERVRYEMTMMMTEQGPAMVVILFAPGVLLGTMTQSVAVCPNPAVVTQEGLEGIVKGLVEGLAAERTRQIQIGPQEAPPGQHNGLGSGPLRSV